jgi:hypothetical protein
MTWNTVIISDFSSFHRAAPVDTILCRSYNENQVQGVIANPRPIVFQAGSAMLLAGMTKG